MAYATVADVQGVMLRDMTADEEVVCTNLLDQAAVIIDAYNKDASAEAKKVVSTRMVSRTFGSSGSDIPVGATQGSMSAMGYSQSWTISSGGAVGEMYLARIDKKLLGLSNQVGTHSPVEDLCKASQSS
ncbi:MAG: hypothetical protein IJ899_09970 [Blautia sp.]|nr:hypothetical protein [Blautia sp.]